MNSEPINFENLTPLEAEINAAIVAIRMHKRMHGTADDNDLLASAIRALQRAGALTAAIYGEVEAITLASGASDDFEDKLIECGMRAFKITAYVGSEQEETTT